MANWLPLESNPELINEYIESLGVRGDYSFCDVFGVDPELLAMIPQPCLAVLMLFPISDKSEEHFKQEQERIERDGQFVDDDLYFMKQTVGNACGTVGVIHAVLNNRENLVLEDSKFFSKFVKETENLNSNERAEFLETNKEIEVEHHAIAEQGESIVEDIFNVNLHFVAFVRKNSNLYELDGRKKFPINHGATSSETFIEVH